jgi:hypothetical protein
MDWIATALNEPIAATNPMNSGDDGLPNFDQFLGNTNSQGNTNSNSGTDNNGSVGGQQPLNFTAHHRPIDFNTTIADISGPTPIPIVSKGSSQGSQQQQQQQQSFGNSNGNTNVRIHPTDMQRYLNGIMQNNNTSHRNTHPNNINMVAKTAGYKMAEAMLLSGNSTGSSGKSSPIAPGSNNGARDSSRQKNDKAVEVHHDHKVIARFRTQTECARYLRATPEAVSYHCSKGGGICNSLVIRPLTSDQIKTLPFGLFDGAVEFRPRERPQLRPETVAILKDWLLSPEHVDNPYPNQRESEMLMKKTGLDKVQLKHWFNNARKRILKPLLKNGGKLGLAKAKAEAAAGVLAAGGQPETGNDTAETGEDGEATGTSASGTKKRDSSKSKGSGPAKKKRKSDGDNDASLSSKKNKGSSSQRNSPSLDLCGTATNSSSSTHKMTSNLTSAQQRRNMAQQHFDESFQQQTQDFHRGDSGNSSSSNHGNTNNNNGMMNGRDNYGGSGGYGGMNNHGGMGMNNMMMMNSSRNFPQDSMMGFNNDMMDGGMMMNSSRMMGGGMRNNSYNDRGSFHSSGSRGSSFNDNFGGGGYQGGGNGMGMGGFNGCMEVGGGNNNGPGRFNDNYDSSNNMNRGGRGNQDGGYPQDNKQGYDRFNSNGSDSYCQPLSSQGQGNQQGPHGGSRRSSNASGGQGNGNSGGQDSPDDSARSNAVFKQQVATMAMNEASTAFKDMEDAFAHAKDVMAQSHAAHPEDDPRVMEANAHAKKCQSVAMFKLKVSQRASEEAANAYDSYQSMMGGGGGSGGSGSNSPAMGRGSMGGRDFS